MRKKILNRTFVDFESLIKPSFKCLVLAIFLLLGFSLDVKANKPINEEVDLALRKTSLNAVAIPNANITFQIEVFNQGLNTATQIQITDYVPSGLTLNDENWVMLGGHAVLKTPIDTLKSGASIIKTITFLVSASPGDKIINTAEISSVKTMSNQPAVDSDSEFDNNPDNDGPAIDDEINQKETDEDDSDFAEVLVKTFGFVKGLVWNDKDGDGILGEGDSGYSGISVALLSVDKSPQDLTATDSLGYFTFEQVEAGDYYISIEKPLGYAFKPDSIILDGLSNLISVSAGDSLVDFSYSIHRVSCEDSLITRLPSKPICAGEDFQVKVNFLSGSDVLWYDAPTGGSLIRTSKNDEAVLLALEETTVFYFQSSDIAEGCPVSRVPVSFFVNPRPLVPNVSSLIETCEDSLINIENAILSAVDEPTNTFEVYNDSTRLSLADSLSGEGKYYLFQKSEIGCFSNMASLEVAEKICDTSKLVDLSITKEANKRTVKIGEEIEYTVSVTNSGNNIATNIEVKDKLPAGLSFVSSGYFDLEADNVLKLHIDTLLQEFTVTFSYVAKATAFGNIINYAEITKADQKDINSTPGNGQESNEDDDDDEIITVLADSTITGADLSLEMTANKTQALIGENIIYSINLTNAGIDTATNVEVVNILPGSLSYVNSSGGDEILVSEEQNSITFKSLSVHPGASVVFQVEAMATTAGEVTNFAEVTKSDQSDPDSTPGAGQDEDDEASSSLTVLAECNLNAPIISTSRSYICPGETVEMMASGCTSVTWSNSVTGNTISFIPSDNAIYTAICKIGDCESEVSNSIQISISNQAKPTVTANKNEICFGEEVALTVNGCPDRVEWSNGATQSSIVVKPEKSTTYTATCRGESCEGNVSNPYAVTVSNLKPPSPTALSLIQNECPVDFVNLNDAITFKPEGSKLVFKDGILPSSPDADSLIYEKGLYYVFASLGDGCLSEPVGIVADVIDCNGISITDLSLSLSADKSAYSLGDTVIFTAIVKNLGPYTLSSAQVEMDWRSLLAIELPTGVLAGNDQLVLPVGNLFPEQSDTIVFKGQIQSEGYYLIVAELQSATSRDVNLANNTAKISFSTLATGSCIANALEAEVTPAGVGLVNVVFTNYVYNCGSVNADSIGLKLDLNPLFKDPVSASLSSVAFNPGSNLVADSSYNGTSNINLLNGGLLSAGQLDTVKVTFKVQHNKVEETVQLFSEAFAYFSESALSDSSNNVSSGIVSGLVSPVEVSLYKEYIVASILNVSNVLKVGEDINRVSFQAVYSNPGDLDVKNILVADSLLKYFGSPASFTVSNISATGGLVVNSEFDGKENVFLTTEESTLEAGAIGTLSFDVNLVNADTAVYFNQLITQATIGLDTVNFKSNWSDDLEEIGEKQTQVDVYVPVQADNCIGIGLAATKREWQQDGSVNITYTAVLGNCGLNRLENITLCDSLRSGLSDESSLVSLVGVPYLSSGSHLVLNDSFDGFVNNCLLKSDSSYLESGGIDTLRYTINIKTSDSLLIKSLTVHGSVDSLQTINDVSNDGLSSSPVGEIPTITVLDSTFSPNLIGLAKSLVFINEVSNNLLDVEFRFRVKNYSESRINNLQIQDDLSNTFGDQVTVESIRFTEIPSNWTVNNSFNGYGDNISLLDSSSVLEAYSSGNLNFVARISIINPYNLQFDNFGLVIGRIENGGVLLDDASANGENPDSNRNGNPKDDSEPTPIDLTEYYTSDSFTPLGLAKSGVAEESTSGATRLTYSVLVKNFGDDTLKNVQLIDNLNLVFGSSSQFSVLVKPRVNVGSSLLPNTQFNGIDDTNLLVSGSSILPGVQDTVTFVVSIINLDSEAQTYKNQVQGTADYKAEAVEDLSVYGEDPDDDGDGNPGNNSGFTINIVGPSDVDTTNIRLLVAEGVSPNGDGINDVFVFEDANGIVPLYRMGKLRVQIINRWGSPVYLSEDYSSDLENGKGWDGSSNMDLNFGKKTNLPNGTYFYVISSSEDWVLNGKRKIGYVTLIN